MDTVRLKAEDTADLEVMATHLQDMILRVGDLAYLPRQRRFAGVGTRFCWELVDPERQKPLKGKHFHRARTGLHFDGVMAVRARGYDQGDKEALLVLLGIGFKPGEDGAGTIVLDFAGGGEIALEVECLDAAMKDLSPPWPTDRLPSHGEG